jgi:hypothetical protein
MKAIAERLAVPAGIDAEGAEADALRRRIGEESYRLHVQQFACAGLNFGYFYPDSPLIAYDGEDAPGYTMYDYQPSTVPGCRTPHFELADGTSVYDALGADYTLLRFDRAIEVAPLLDAAEAAGVPLDLLDIDLAERPDGYRHGLLLSRPDRHVAWRGDQVPTDPTRLIDRVTGRAPGLAPRR